MGGRSMWDFLDTDRRDTWWRGNTRMHSPATPGVPGYEDQGVVGGGGRPLQRCMACYERLHGVSSSVALADDEPAVVGSTAGQRGV
jgi:hypothetical protein